MRETEREDQEVFAGGANLGPARLPHQCSHYRGEGDFESASIRPCLAQPLKVLASTCNSSPSSHELDWGQTPASLSSQPQLSGAEAKTAFCKDQSAPAWHAPHDAMPLLAKLSQGRCNGRKITLLPFDISISLMADRNDRARWKTCRPQDPSRPV